MARTNKKTITKNKTVQSSRQLYRRVSMVLVSAALIGFGGYYAVASAMTTASPDNVKPTNADKQSQSGSTKAVSSNPGTQPISGGSAAVKPTTAPTNVNGKVMSPNGTSTSLPAATPAVAPVRTSDAAVLARLASQPTAQWFGDWSGDVQASVNNYINASRASGRMPVLVAYNIPYRDCGGESAGGTAGSVSYGQWIRQFANGIAGRSVTVILEPDAVAADCFNDARAMMLSDAVGVVQAAGGRVYIDAGNSTWRSSSTMAERLKRAGISNATGFSLNISNYISTPSNVSYGNAISGQVSGKHFVIDTSRNGNGASAGNEWCNASGRALGALPTTQTGHSLVDALLWIKVPGESDGRCGAAINGSQPPAAGVFWKEYALMLARNAGW